VTFYSAERSVKVGLNWIHVQWLLMNFICAKEADAHNMANSSFCLSLIYGIVF